MVLSSDFTHMLAFCLVFLCVNLITFLIAMDPGMFAIFRKASSHRRHQETVESQVSKVFKRGKVNTPQQYTRAISSKELEDMAPVLTQDVAPTSTNIPS